LKLAMLKVAERSQYSSAVLHWMSYIVVSKRIKKSKTAYYRNSRIWKNRCGESRTLNTIQKDRKYD